MTQILNKVASKKDAPRRSNIIKYFTSSILFSYAQEIEWVNIFILFHQNGIFFYFVLTKKIIYVCEKDILFLCNGLIDGFSNSITRNVQVENSLTRSPFHSLFIYLLLLLLFEKDFPCQLLPWTMKEKNKEGRKKKKR